MVKLEELTVIQAPIQRCFAISLEVLKSILQEMSIPGKGL